jgi:hypothetical protein
MSRGRFFSRLPRGLDGPVPLVNRLAVINAARWSDRPRTLSEISQSQEAHDPNVQREANFTGPLHLDFTFRFTVAPEVATRTIHRGG